MIDWLPEHFHFLRPEWLMLGPALWLLERLLHRRPAADPFRGIIDPVLLENLRVKRPKRGWFTPENTLRVLFVLAIIIIAGPSWRQQSSPLAEDAAPVVIALDISASMAAQDVAPSRLERARQKISDLLPIIADKQVALVVYAGSAHTVLPLTSDHDIARSYLSALDTNIAPRAGKFPEYALTSIDRTLSNSRYEGSVILVTDGLGASSAPLIQAWCQRNPHHMLLYGIGSRNAEEAPLDARGLSRLADDCSGDYVELSLDDRDVRALARGLSDRYRIIDDEALPWLDGGYPLVFPALALALLWFRRGWTRVWMWLVLPWMMIPNEQAMAQAARDRSVVAESAEIDLAGPEAISWTEQVFDQFAQLWLTPDQYGWLLMEMGYPSKAARVFEDPTWKASAHYYAEEFRLAALLFTRHDSDAALFNEANAHAQRRDYVRARVRFDQLLARNPSYPGAKENRDQIQALIDEINRLSESQQEESGVGGEDIDADQDAQIGEGTEQLVAAEMREQYSAEEILSSPETADMWLRNVQQAPANFLRTKFSVQLEERGVSEP